MKLKGDGMNAKGIAGRRPANVVFLERLSEEQICLVREACNEGGRIPESKEAAAELLLGLVSEWEKTGATEYVADARDAALSLKKKCPIANGAFW